MSSKSVYTFIHTPSHGYLQVSRAEFEASGVEVSEYSYQTPDSVYLEEDSDAPAYLDYLTDVQGLDVRLESKHFDVELHDLYVQLKSIVKTPETDLKRSFAKLNRLHSELGILIAELKGLL